MTPQEALNLILKEAHSYYEEWDEELPDELVEAEELIQELVDKETPKKARYVNYGRYKIGDWYCPHCCAQIDGFAEPKRCSECGGELDWSDD